MQFAVFDFAMTFGGEKLLWNIKEKFALFEMNSFNKRTKTRVGPYTLAKEG